MSESMFADLLAAQKEMPALQKSAINPHFKNRYVPLEELLQTVVPILNKHNFVLLQMPCQSGGDMTPALYYELRHISGETIGSTMPLLCGKEDPQGQGSAITYARRYSLMSLLGLTADVDDDADATRTVETNRAPRPQPRGGQERPAVARNGNTAPVQAPQCDTHGAMRYVKAGTSKAGKPYSAFWGCVQGCTTRSVNDGDWQAQLLALSQTDAVEYDPAELPFE